MAPDSRGVCKVEVLRRQPGGRASSHWGVVVGLEASSAAEGCQGGEFLGLSLFLGGGHGEEMMPKGEWLALQRGAPQSTWVSGGKGLGARARKGKLS